MDSEKALRNGNPVRVLQRLATPSVIVVIYFVSSKSRFLIPYHRRGHRQTRKNTETTETLDERCWAITPVVRKSETCYYEAYD